MSEVETTEYDLYEEAKKEDAGNATKANPESFQNVSLGLTPFGKISLNVRDSNGNTVVADLDIQQAGQLAVHSLALISLLVSQQYMIAMQEQMMASQLLANPTAGKELWTP